ncbi:hypothetical protein [Micromonospora sp. CPCC 206061]|uniref:hypothetical protein n=1 Tax=Micromonospora sp. CPCC 206061 TaxID=3122410 RepID=UPI002FF223EF
MAAGASHVYRPGLLPGDLSAPEPLGEIKVTTGAQNMPGQSSVTGLVQLAWPGVDLVIDQIEDVTLAPGKSMDVASSRRYSGSALPAASRRNDQRLTGVDAPSSLGCSRLL